MRRDTMRPRSGRRSRGILKVAGLTLLMVVMPALQGCPVAAIAQVVIPLIGSILSGMASSQGGGSSSSGSGSSAGQTSGGPAVTAGTSSSSDREQEDQRRRQERENRQRNESVRPGSTPPSSANEGASQSDALGR